MTERGDPPAVLLEALHKRFGKRIILQDLTLRAEPGERIALLGESGSGKSTLLNIIAGLEPADAGRVEVAGRSLIGLDDDHAAALRRQLIGFAFQAFHLLGHLSVQRNVAVPLLLNGLPPAQALERAATVLGRLGLGDRLHAPISELSGGEQQRVALARALVAAPRVLLADEPTGNLDTERSREIMNLLRSLQTTRELTILMVTHERDMAAYAHRVVHFVDGRVASDVATEALPA
jgi:putative ABC transport system ATP-binding protein